MKRLVLAAAASALAALLVPTASLAKGASEATISGPGLGDGIKLAGEEAPGGGTLMLLAEYAGFFPALFQTSPNPMLTERPKGSLGPLYRITYAMPGPDAVVNQLRQDLYPYATPEPVTYMKPGQAYFGSGKTVGGWYISGPSLKNQLVRLGLPETPPAGNGFDAPWPILAFAAFAAAGATVIVAVRIRRRPRPATAC